MTQAQVVQIYREQAQVAVDLGYIETYAPEDTRSLPEFIGNLADWHTEFTGE